MYLNDLKQINRKNLASVRQRCIQRQLAGSHSDYSVPKMYKCNGKPSLHSYYNRKISDSCTNVPNFVTIDPLESTDSMVCAFASVANVVSDDGMSEYLSMDEDLQYKTNRYIIEVKPNSASYSSDQSNNTDIESESHFYETIYPSKQKCAELRTDINVESKLEQNNCNNNCDEEKVSSSNSDEKCAPLPVVGNCGSSKCQLVEIKCKSILKENVKMKLINADARRKSDVSSSIASSTQTVRLQPDEVYPGYVADVNSNKSRDHTSSGEVNYAVIIRDCNTSVDCETQNVTNNNENVCKSVRESSADNGDSADIVKSELILGNSCDEKRQQSKSFFRKFNGFKKAISRAFNAEKVTKAKKDDGPPLETCRSVPVLTTNKHNNNNKQHHHHISADNLPSLSLEPEMDAKNSFVKSLKSRMSLRRKPAKIKVKVDIQKNEKNSSGSGNGNGNSKANNEKKAKWKRSNTESRCCLSPDSRTDGVWGELKQLYSNGSQLIELHRVAGKHFGFFVARGTVNNVKGVFVSRMRDEETQKSLTGLLEIGDEIIAIDGVNVKNSNIIQVNQLMAHKTRIILHVIPYVNHKYR